MLMRAGKPRRRIKALNAKWGRIIDVERALDKIHELVSLKGLLVGTERSPNDWETEPEPPVGDCALLSLDAPTGSQEI
jgi:hypothetical protein